MAVINIKIKYHSTYSLWHITQEYNDIMYQHYYNLISGGISIIVLQGGGNDQQCNDQWDYITHVHLNYVLPLCSKSCDLFNKSNSQASHRDNKQNVKLTTWICPVLNSNLHVPNE